MRFALYLRALRVTAELTTTQVAAALGCCPAYVTQLEREVRPPSPDRIRQLAGLYGVGAETLAAYHRDERISDSLREIAGMLGEAGYREAEIAALSARAKMPERGADIEPPPKVRVRRNPPEKAEPQPRIRKRLTRADLAAGRRPWEVGRLSRGSAPRT